MCNSNALVVGYAVSFRTKESAGELRGLTSVCKALPVAASNDEAMSLAGAGRGGGTAAEAAGRNKRSIAAAVKERAREKPLTAHTGVVPARGDEEDARMVDEEAAWRWTLPPCLCELAGT